MQLKNDECEKGQQCEVLYVVGTSTFQKWMFVKGRFMGKSEPERKEQNGLKWFVVFWCIQRSEQPFNLVLGLSSSVFFMVQKQHSVYLTRHKINGGYFKHHKCFFLSFMYMDKSM